ncbi:MAG: UDP-N-acetylmuramate dehydrogenase [Acidobacteria bacterium]|nr:UDP-N-acetylmuramate dehydrogenase [Acidobacteriota bacterium]
MEIQENVPLAPHTTLGVGGAARFFARVTSEKDVVSALEFAVAKGVAVFVLGGGSNLLVSDDGFPGLVIHIALRGISAQGETITAAAGEDWDSFVEHMVQQDLGGVECLSGIPGFVGGTPVQNVGAYGQEVADTIISVRCLDRHTRGFVELSSEECKFTYRTSIFNSEMRDRYIVLGVTFSLEKGGEPKVFYKDLVEHFDGRHPTLIEVREAVLKIRRSKSMVMDPTDPNSRSAGSFFKNPIVERTRLGELEDKFGRVPFFEYGDRVKIPAAWLIEHAGFCKGYKLGRAGTSSNHSLALINRNGATAKDLIALKDKIQAGVREKYGIELIPEPVFLGF